MLKHFARAAGIEKPIWIHLLRHSFATNLADAGVSIETISAGLMHSSLAMTEKYISKLNSQRRVQKAIALAFGEDEPQQAPAKPLPERAIKREDVKDWI